MHEGRNALLIDTIPDKPLSEPDWAMFNFKELQTKMGGAGGVESRYSIDSDITDTGWLDCWFSEVYAFASHYHQRTQFPDTGVKKSVWSN